MTKRTVMSLVCIIFLLSIAPNVGHARVLDQEKVRIQVEVPIMQELRVIEPLVVAINPSEERSALYATVGKIEVKSNSNWTLTVDAIYNPNLQVDIRPSKDQLMGFRAVDGVHSVFSGPTGSSEITWDVRIEAPETGSYEQTEYIHFVFTLESI